MEVTTFDVMNTFGKDGKTKMLKSVPAINQCIKTLLLAERGELMGDPVFGLNFRDYTYKLNTYVVRDLVSDEITNSILKYDKRINEVNNTISSSEDVAIIDITYAIDTQIANLTLTITEEV